MLKLLRRYFTLGSLATVASIVGITAGAETIFGSHGGGGGGGGGGGVPGAMGYVPQWQGGADQLWQQIMQQMGGDANTERSTLMPFLQQMFGDASSRAPGIQQMMRGFGGDMAGEGGNLIAAGNRMRGAGDQVWQTALDPQHALYDRTVQQLTDQTRGADSARGIAMSGVSSGTEGQTLSNFNIDWNNAQLQRQLAGLSGMSGAYNEGGRNTQAGTSELAGATSMMQGADSWPYQLSGLYSGAMGQGVFNPFQALQGNLGTYMGFGQSGGQNAFNQQQTGLNNLTTGLTQLGQQPWFQQFFGGSSGGSGNSGSGASSQVDDNGWGGA